MRPSVDEAGTWSVLSAGKIIINDGTVDVSEAEITSFDYSTFVITRYESAGTGIQFRFTMKK